MKPISRLADKKPLLFGLLALLTWIALGALINGIVAFLLKMPFADSFVQLAGISGATCILLLLAFRLGWLGKIGITDFGTLPVWALTLLIAIYVVLAGWYSFFGQITFELSSLVDTPEARAILLQTLPVALAEETMFRGIVLYALVRVWGQTKRGLVTAVVVQAALFGALHALQVLAGTTLDAALANVLATFIFGIWVGGLVLSVGTLWPAIVLHTASNAFILIKGLSSRWVDPVSLGYLQEAFFEIPLALLGLWIMLKVRSVRQPSSQVMPETDSDARQLAGVP
jgi:membrane protease YdiL (CAAX protease family)